ncbi:MAG: hypothetical protein ABIG96_05620 [Candidatus Micrarchaeota archaeon]
MGMRGIVSFALLLAMLFPLLMVAGSFRKAHESASSAISGQISAERFFSAGEEARNAFRQVLGNSLGKGRLRAADAASKLNELERALEAKFGEDGFDADAWFGIASDGEMRRIVGKMESGKGAEKCNICFDFTRTSVAYDGRMAFFSEAFLFDGPGGLGISRKSFSEFPESTGFAALPLRAHFGISLHDDRLEKVAVITMDEGFG